MKGSNIGESEPSGSKTFWKLLATLSLLKFLANTTCKDLICMPCYHCLLFCCYFFFGVNTKCCFKCELIGWFVFEWFLHSVFNTALWAGSKYLGQCLPVVFKCHQCSKTKNVELVEFMPSSEGENKDCVSQNFGKIFKNSLDEWRRPLCQAIVHRCSGGNYG